MVEKTPARDLIGDLKSATNGYVVDKLEGFTIDVNGDAFIDTAIGGVDDSSGETIFVSLGKVEALN